MDKITKKEIGETVVAAAKTCETLVSLAQDEDEPVTDNRLMGMILMALVGINQALVAIAEGIICDE